MKQNKKIAVTGGIGSGKSLFMRAVKEAGFPTLSCDEEYRALLTEESFLKGLFALFPQAEEGGKFHKKALAALVFSDENARRQLNAYAHPRIMARIFEKAEKFPVVFVEVPLLFESDLEGAFDLVIAVRRNKEERLRAVVTRDGGTKEEALLRMAAQFPPEELENKECLILENDGTEQEFLEKATAMIRSVTS